MNTGSIRFRLTAWYFAVLAVSLCLFGAAMLVAMRQAILHAADEELEARLEAVGRFLERQAPRLDGEGLEDEFREHSGLEPGRDLLQVLEPATGWSYRSRGMRSYGLPAPATPPPAGDPRFYTAQPGGSRLRVLEAAVSVGEREFLVQIATPVEESFHALEMFGWFLAGSLPLILAAATLGGYWMSRRALAPVDAITQAARRISAENLSLRLEVPRTGDELERLSETLNDMMRRIEAAFRRMTRFTADASHELRTPVSIMRTTAELALRRERSPEEYREALQQILIELERTSRLIEDLLTLARADSGIVDLDLQSMDLAGTLRDACSQGEKLARSRGVAFRAAVPDGRLPIRGDPTALRRLFLILIDNAVKYTPPGGRVEVRLESRDGYAVGEVRDTGIGIAPEDLPHIFERFWRADKVRSREMGGAGLGLSIARWIAEVHRGVIEVESEPGKGSAFRVRLPREPGDGAGRA